MQLHIDEQTARLVQDGDCVFETHLPWTVDSFREFSEHIARIGGLPSIPEGSYASTGDNQENKQ
jgi:hypothetical protein